MALSSGMAEALHVQQLLEDLRTGMCTTTFTYNNTNKKCMTLYTDSTSATSLASKPGVNRRSRHIALRYLWIQDLRQAGEVDIKRVTTHENPADIYTKLLPAPVLQKHLPPNGLLALLDGEGEEECMYHLKHHNKSKILRTRTTKLFDKITTTTCTRPSSSTRSKMLNYKDKLMVYNSWLERERDIEVRDLAYKDLLGQILRAQHALQALQDHLTEQHMRQLLGAEPLQAILGAISKKEEYDKHYIKMIDSIDPIAILQQEEQEKEQEATTGGVSLQQRAEEIIAAIHQRKQQSRQQQQLQRVTTNDNNDDNGRREGEDYDRRRIKTSRRQGGDTTAENRLAIIERPERGELQVRRRRRRRLVVATTTAVLACLSTVTTSLSHFVFTTLPFVAQQLQVASDYVSWRQVERLQLIYNYSCQAGDYYRSYYRTTWELYYKMTTTPKKTEEVIDVEQTTTPATSLPPLKAPPLQH